MLQMNEVRCYQVSPLFADEITNHLDSRIGKLLVTDSRSDRVRIVGRDDDTTDAGGDDGLDTGWRLAMVTTRLEGDVEICSRRLDRRTPRRLDAVHLGMVIPEATVPTLDDRFPLHKNSTHRWIGCNMA